MYHGEAKSRLFPVQGNVLAALLFRLHFPLLVNHLLTDDLTIIMQGALEQRLLDNIKNLQCQAKIVLKELMNFSENFLLPVTVAKTKAMLVHNAVNVSKPEIKYKEVPIEYVINFKCIDDRLQKVKKSYCGVRKIF